MTFLHQACISTTSHELVFNLVVSGCNPNSKDKNGFTPLHYACQYVKLDIIQVLLKSNVLSGCVNELTLTNNETPLHLLIQFSTHLNVTLVEKIVYLMLLHGGFKSLVYTNKSQKQTPFEIACDLGRTNLVEVILRFCASQQININPSTNATLTTDGKKFRLLNIISKYSVNSLHLASRNGHNDIIRLLLAYDVCDLNGQDTTNGCTALHEAARYGRYQTVKVLLECGADLTLKNFYGKRALDVVIKNNKIGSDIKCLINEFGQTINVVSIKAHFNAHAGSLNFEKNELITVLESPKLTSACSSSSVVLNTEFNSNNVAALNWRGFILNKTNYTTRFGYFPSSYVALVEQNVNTNNNNTSNETLNIKRPSFLTSSTTSLAISQYSKQLTPLNSDVNVDNISVIEKIASDQVGSAQNPNEIIYSSNIKFKNKNETHKQENQVSLYKTRIKCMWNCNLVLQLHAF